MRDVPSLYDRPPPSEADLLPLTKGSQRGALSPLYLVALAVLAVGSATAAAQPSATLPAFAAAAADSEDEFDRAARY